MKILLRHTSIDYSHYDAAVLHETFGIISLRVKAEIDERCLQLPMIFRDGKDAREAYTRILHGRNSRATSVSLSDLECSWPAETAQKIEQYAQHIFDFDRPVKM